MAAWLLILWLLSGAQGYLLPPPMRHIDPKAHGWRPARPRAIRCEPPKKPPKRPRPRRDSPEPERPDDYDGDNA